jgi:hypothetical protein
MLVATKDEGYAVLQKGLSDDRCIQQHHVEVQAQRLLKGPSSAASDVEYWVMHRDGPQAPE